MPEGRGQCKEAAEEALLEAIDKNAADEATPSWFRVSWRLVLLTSVLAAGALALLCRPGGGAAAEALLRASSHPPAPTVTLASSMAQLEEAPAMRGAALAMESAPAPAMAAEHMVAEAPRCLSSYKVSDFSSKDRMEAAGWMFGWNGEGTFKPQKLVYSGLVRKDSYWGFSNVVDGELALVLRGRGVLTLDFGNAMPEGAGGRVAVFLNGEPRGRASAGEPSKLLTARFRDGDVLKFLESPGVIVINSLTFHCAAEAAPPAPRGAAQAAAPTRPLDGEERERLEEEQSLLEAKRLWEFNEREQAEEDRRKVATLGGRKRKLE